MNCRYYAVIFVFTLVFVLIWYVHFLFMVQCNKVVDGNHIQKTG